MGLSPLTPYEWEVMHPQRHIMRLSPLTPYEWEVTHPQRHIGTATLELDITVCIEPVCPVQALQRCLAPMPADTG